ncbi:hypothetical protein [Pseudomonas sp. Irchel s3h14]|uniref:hypothetical protein n=1 Tax=Pseudomonas sp. Irchel s3h14 TaxID=2009179 RepID=UPI000BA374F9|nr:hypothetical protein [Pseudomonas sp. Irchel s3h14]
MIDLTLESIDLGKHCFHLHDRYKMTCGDRQTPEDVAQQILKQAFNAACDIARSIHQHVKKRESLIRNRLLGLMY